MISDERLDAVAKMKAHPMILPPNHDECIEMAKELQAYQHKLIGSVAFSTISNIGCNLSFAKYTNPGDLK